MSHSLSGPKKTQAFSAPPHRFVVPAVESVAAEAEADTVAAAAETEIAVVVSANGFGAAGTVVWLAQCASTDYWYRIAGLMTQKNHSSLLMMHHHSKHLAPLGP